MNMKIKKEVISCNNKKIRDRRDSKIDCNVQYRVLKEGQSSQSEDYLDDQ